MENIIHSYLLQSLCKTHLKKKIRRVRGFSCYINIEQEKKFNF